MRTLEELQKLQQEIFSQPDAKASGYSANDREKEIERLAKMQQDIFNSNKAATAQTGSTMTADEQRIKDQLDKITSKSNTTMFEDSEGAKHKLTPNEVKEGLKNGTLKLDSGRNMFGDYFNQGTDNFVGGLKHAGYGIDQKLRNSFFEPIAEEQIKQAESQPKKQPLIANTLFPTKAPTTKEAVDKLNAANFFEKPLAVSLDKGIVNNAVERGDADLLKAKKYASEMARKDLNEKTATKAAELEEKYKDADPKAKGAAQLIGGGLGSVAPMMLANVVPGLGYLASGVSGGGNAYNEARNDGASVDQAFNNAVLSGATSAAIEKMAGGLPGMGKGKIDFGALGNLAKGKFGKAVLTRVGESIGEGVEEGVDAFIQPHLKQLTYGKEVNYSTLPSEVLASFGGGVAVGGILGGGGDIVNGAKSLYNGKQANNAMTATDKNGVLTAQDIAESKTKLFGNDEVVMQGQTENNKPLETIDANGNIVSANSENTTSTAQNIVNDKGKQPYTQQQLDVINAYKSATDNNLIEYANFIKENPNEKMSYQLGNVSSAKADVISNMVGFDVSDFKEAITPETIKHIDKRHGVNGIADKSMANVEDVARIKWVMDNFDNVILDPTTSKAFTNSDRKAAKKIVLSKRVNGTYYVVEAVPNTSKKQMQVVTAYKTKATQQPSDVLAPRDTSENASADIAFNTNIAQNNTDVNSFEQQNSSQYESTTNEQQSAQVNSETSYDYETIRKAHTEAQKLSRQLNKVQSKNQLTPAESAIVTQLVNGTTLESSLDNMVNINKNAVIEVYKAKKALKDARQPIEDNKKAVNAKLHSDMSELIQNSDTWKDKKIGLAYSTETAERNIRDITKNSPDGEKIIKTIFSPVHTNEALKNKYKNKMYNEVRKYGIDKLTKQESVYANMYGEKIRIENEIKNGGRVNKAESEYILKNEAAYYKKHKDKINMKNVQNALPIILELYNVAYTDINKSRVENGEEPIDFRKSYLPHGDLKEPKSLVGKLLALVGFKYNADKLPIDLVGQTQNFKPNSRYNVHGLEREGFETDFDLLKHFNNYIDVAADVIYHTGDIKRVRAFRQALIEKHCDDGMKAEINKIKENTDITDNEKNTLIEKILKNGNTQLGGFANWANEYANVLAGKKSLSDRGVESALNRGIYSVMNNVMQRMSSNMIVANIGSALTNFIPLTQMAGECSQKNILRAIKDTIKSSYEDDGFSNNSTFLINREGSVPLARTYLDVAIEKLALPMQLADTFTSNVAVRAKYLDNIKAGMDTQTAMENADAYAANLIADRSLGALPTIFNNKNPIYKLFTTFQVEANNQLRYLWKDLPRAKKDDAIKGTAWALIKMAIGAYLYNDIYEKLTGRKPALDAIGIVNETIGDVTGYKLPNTVDVFNGITNSQGITFTTSQKKPSQVLGNMVTRVGGQVPFVGGLLDGGRLPISSALPYFGRSVGEWADTFSGDVDSEKASETAKKEFSKLLYYFGLPAGGGAVKKFVEGADVLLKGGSFTKDNNGQDKMRFAVEKPSVGEMATALIFGPYATKGGKEYIANGFKGMSAKDTANYKEAVSTGMSGDMFKTFLSMEKDIKADKNEKGNSIPGSKKKKTIDAINMLPITAQQKQLLLKTAGYEENEESVVQNEVLSNFNDTLARQKKINDIMILPITDAQKYGLLKAAGYVE